MHSLSVMLKPASGQCNMHCDYCFYCDEATKRNIPSYGMMEEKTIKNYYSQSIEAKRKKLSALHFKVGSLLYAVRTFFEKVIELENQYNTHHCSILNSLQTNGLCIDENLVFFFQKCITLFE